LAAVYAWSRYRALALGLIAWTAAVGLSIVYLGEHYVVDILDGLLYVAVATIIVEAVSRRWGRRGPKPVTPATPSA
jgi:membrane-associated phospholipid phosphatase